MVKALDLKSNGVSPRRFESCSQRNCFAKSRFFVQKGHVGKVLAVLFSFKSAFNELDQAILQDLPADVADAVILWVF